MAEDPYKKYGGAAVEDPYAKYGGSASKEDRHGASGAWEAPPTIGQRARGIAKSVGSGIVDSMKAATTSNLMVPGVEQLPPMPLTPSGKVDWDAARRMPATDRLYDARPIIDTIRHDPARAVGQAVPFAVAGGLRGRSLSNPPAPDSAAGTARAVAGKLPKVHPIAKFLAKRIPGVGTAIDVVEALREKYGETLESVPKVSRDELANQLYKESHGVEVKTAQQRVDAIKELSAALKAPKVEASAPAKAPKAPEPFKPNPGIARRSRFGGIAEPDYSPAAPRTGRIVKPSDKPLTPQPKQPTVPEVPDPKAPEPFKPNPNIARKSRFGGIADPDYSPAPSRAGRAAKPQPRGSSSKTNFMQHLRDRGPIAPSVQAEQLARWLKAKGVSASDVTKMSTSDWKIAAASSGLPEPTPEIIEAARGQLAWRRAPSLSQIRQQGEGRNNR